MHTCAHPYCEKQIPLNRLACPKHWFQLPESYRDRIWDYYRPGQETTREISQEYATALRGCEMIWGMKYRAAQNRARYRGETVE